MRNLTMNQACEGKEILLELTSDEELGCKAVRAGGVGHDASVVPDIFGVQINDGEQRHRLRDLDLKPPAVCEYIPIFEPGEREGFAAFQDRTVYNHFLRHLFVSREAERLEPG